MRENDLDRTESIAERNVENLRRLHAGWITKRSTAAHPKKTL